MLCGQKLTCYYKKGNREQKLEINSPFLKEKKYVYNYLYTYYMYMEGMKSKMSRNFTSSRRIETFLVLFLYRANLLDKVKFLDILLFIP